MRLLGGNKKGYPLAAFNEAFERYLPPFAPELLHPRPCPYPSKTRHNATILCLCGSAGDL
jgi:hypothetical protein